MYISNDELRSFIVSVIGLMCLNTLPEVFKGYLKGVFKSFGMQQTAMYINMSGCWVIQIALVWLFAFYMDMQITGIFLAKLLMETYLLVLSYVTIEMQDWDKIRDEIRKR